MYVEKCSDDLWLGVKRQTNLAIAGSPRNICRYSLRLKTCEVEILEEMWARKRTHFYQTPNAQVVTWESALGGNLLVQKGNNPDHQLRSLIFA